MNNNNIKILFITEKLKINFINVFIFYTSSYGLFIINLVGLVVFNITELLNINFKDWIKTFKRIFYSFNCYIFSNFLSCNTINSGNLKIKVCTKINRNLKIFIYFFHFLSSFLELIIFISYLIVRFLKLKFLIFGSDLGSDFGSKSKPPQLIVQIFNPKFLNSGNDSGNDFGNESIPPQLIVQILNSKFLNPGSDLGSLFGSKSKPLYLILQIFKPKFLIFGSDLGSDFGSETFYKKDKISSWKAKMEWTTLRLKYNGLIAYLHNP